MLKELVHTDNSSPSEHSCGGCGRSIRDRFVCFLLYFLHQNINIFNLQIFFFASVFAFPLADFIF